MLKLRVLEPNTGVGFFKIFLNLPIYKNISRNNFSSGFSKSIFAKKSNESRQQNQEKVPPATFTSIL